MAKDFSAAGRHPRGGDLPAARRLDIVGPGRGGGEDHEGRGIDGPVGRAAGGAAPYGEAVARALAHARAAAGDLGLPTRAGEGRWVAADAGEGEPYVAAIGHLDVVPPGAGWTRTPFEPTIEGDRVYARGSADDKGGSFAALLAVAAINDLLGAGDLALPRRVRVIFGGDEESGMTCAQHYAATNPPPAFAVAPDGEWPVVFAEKGQALVTLEGAFPAGGELYVERLESGSRANVVPDLAECVLAGSGPALDAAAEALAGYWDRNITCRRDDGGIEITAVGLGGHGSRPFGSDNAAIRLVRALCTLSLDASGRWQKVFALFEPSGDGLGLAQHEPIAGPTTSNLGVLGVRDGRVRMSFDVRYAISRDQPWVLQQVASAAGAAGLEIVESSGIAPLHQPVDGALVRTVMAVYNAETDLGRPPYARGARTYAAYIPNGVSVGRNDPAKGETGVHGPDESCSVGGLGVAGRMLARVLIRLARTDAE